jgi:hypothetical protein
MLKAATPIARRATIIVTVRQPNPQLLEPLRSERPGERHSPIAPPLVLPARPLCDAATPVMGRILIGTAMA